MSDAIKIQDYPQLDQIVYPSKSTTADGMKISQEDDRVSLISSATLRYKTKRGALYTIGTNTMIKVRCDVQFLHQVRRRVRGWLLVEEFETGRSARYTIITGQGHGDDLIQFQIDETDKSNKIIAFEIRRCSIKTARENYQKVVAKFKEYGMENLTPLEPQDQEPMSQFVRFRGLLSCQDSDLTWHHYEAKSEAILLKLPPSPKLVGVWPNEIRLSGGCAVTVKLDRDLITGYDLVAAAFLKLPGNPEQEVIINAPELQDDRDAQRDTVSLSIGEYLPPDESVRAWAKIRLLGSSGGIGWCVEGGVSVLPASLPPTKLERQNRVMSADAMEDLEDVDWAALISGAQD